MRGIVRVSEAVVDIMLVSSVVVVASMVTVIFQPLVPGPGRVWGALKVVGRVLVKAGKVEKLVEVLSISKSSTGAAEVGRYVKEG